MKDLTGTRFTRLLVTGFSHSDSRLKPYWRCLCDCGKAKVVRADALTRHHALSCGCYHRDTCRNGATINGKMTRTYSIWAGMRQRCRDPKIKAYRFYGARGVRVCERWEDYANFLADMGEVPSGLTIDRIDVNKGYEPANCRWATWTEQHRNKRTSVLCEATVGRIKRLIADGMRPCEVAKTLSVSAASVSAIANGKQWVDVPAAPAAVVGEAA